MDRVSETAGHKFGSKWYNVNDGFYVKVTDSEASGLFFKCIRDFPCRATMALTSEIRTLALFIRRAALNQAPDFNWPRVAALRQATCTEDMTKCGVCVVLYPV
ncbi:hypothetical protein J6590_094439 [Homalodisca vitripennis]|nr:hypothetical protein J6590_094439 [Homalodisca vitripennis]